jgi:hypothetical protein
MAAFQQVVDKIKGMEDWPGLPEAFQDSVLQPFEQRGCHDLALPVGQLACERCGASLPQMESDLAAAGGLRMEALRRIQQYLEPEEKIEHIRLAEAAGLTQAIGSADDVEAFLDRLRDVLIKLVEAGSKVIVE